MIYEKIKAFKRKINRGSALGVFSKTSDPAFIEVMGYSKLDFVIIDLEHGPNSVQSVENLIRASEVSDIFPIVRVKERNFSVIGEVLDIGACGIQVPQITDAQSAENVIRHSKFAPDGIRGVCRFVRAAEYSSMDRFTYFKRSNDTVVILQLEGQKAMDNLNEIISTRGVDIIFIGPYDLSQSLGVTGRIDHPLVEQKMREIIDTCKQKGVVVGTFVDTIENAFKWEKLGVKYLAYSVDVGIFYDKCVEIVQAMKNSK